MSAYVRMAARQGGEPEGTVALVDEKRAIAIVADGTGGPIGSKAAAAAASPALDRARRAVSPEETFEAAREAALAAMRPEDAGAGASLVTARIDRTGTLELGHIGSVRAYLARPQGGHTVPEPAAGKLCPTVVGPTAQLVCLTRDHSTVCDLVERGYLSRDDARRHPLRTRLTRGLRHGEAARPDIARLGLYPGDRLVLCSDGVWDRVDDATLLALLEQHPTAEAACDAIATAVTTSSKRNSFGVVVLDCFPPREASRRADNDARPSHQGAHVERGAPPENEGPKPRGGADAGAVPGRGAKPGSPREGRGKEAEELSPEGFLEKFGRNITELAAAGKLDNVIGRQREIDQLAQALVARRKSNAVLIGPPGVGKTAIVEGLAVEMVAGRLGSRFADMRIVEIAMGAIVAGTQYRGQFEERMLNVVRAAEADPKLVIFIDELHTAMGAGATRGNSSDAADLLKPALARGSMRLIGATTTEEYQKFIERDAAFARRLTVVEVAEPSIEHSIEILRGLRGAFEKHYGVEIDADAFEAAAKLSARYVVGRYLPDKAIDLIDRGCARLLVGPGAAGERKRLQRDHVVELVADMCSVDVELIGRDLQEARTRISELGAYLRARIFGQNAAIAAVARQIERAYGGLKDPKRPIASFLFVGPTGVGKTEAAKVVAEFLFHDRDRVLRIDMSEYHDRWAIARLIGAPPGYIGHDEEGQLTGPMRRHGARVVLFDEIEKAHPDVLLVLLQILDEGRLTDSRGREASFHEAVIVMTSNLLQDGVRRAPKRIGFRQEDSAPADDEPAPAADEQDALRQELARHLRPELVGRIGEVVAFQPLNRDAARSIVNARCRAAKGRLHAQGATIDLPETFADEVLARLGDLRFGARMIERLVDERLGELLDQARPAPQRGQPPSKSLGPIDPAASMSAGARASARTDVAILVFTPDEPIDEPARRALVTSVCIGPHAAQVREVDASTERVVVLTATLPAALAIAQRHDASRGVALHRLVHRGRVQLDADHKLQGVGLYVIEQVRQAIAASSCDSQRVVMTSVAYDALEPEHRARFVPLPCEALEALGSTITLWIDGEGRAS